MQVRIDQRAKFPRAFEPWIEVKPQLARQIEIRPLAGRDDDAVHRSKAMRAIRGVTVDHSAAGFAHAGDGDASAERGTRPVSTSALSVALSCAVSLHDPRSRRQRPASDWRCASPRMLPFQAPFPASVTRSSSVSAAECPAPTTNGMRLRPVAGAISPIRRECRRRCIRRARPRPRPASRGLPAGLAATMSPKHRSPPAPEVDAGHVPQRAMAA